MQQEYYSSYCVQKGSKMIFFTLLGKITDDEFSSLPENCYRQLLQCIYTNVIFYQNIEIV